MGWESWDAWRDSDDMPHCPSTSMQHAPFFVRPLTPFFLRQLLWLFVVDMTYDHKGRRGS